ncbi:hypothetical protein BofuT4_P108950.1 [Botrytis cinerea T4]|uniref:Phosphoribosylformylglycinamidine synthase n=1 Tax=Botryotinia fuckeliana (strain T4) TaxID=999810 RepID=G2Y7A9_BOTF4|nr:hypothetical protein BofuT4_P108950.1 [Botrytis cinerea T4]
MEYLKLPGDSCFTPAEATKLAARINDLHQVKVELTGVWIHYAHLRHADPETEAKITQLLPVSGVDLEAKLGSKIYYVTPRNLSPWSSKATNIAHVCGLESQVQRIERGRAILIKFADPSEAEREDLPFKDILYDRMTENMSAEEPDVHKIFEEGEPIPLEVIDLWVEGSTPIEVLKAYNVKRGLALDTPEMEYLVEKYTQHGRSPTDVELFMFAQVNSEHCRHKQFNANWTIDGMEKSKVHRSAYSDNAAVLQGEMASHWAPEYSTGSWKQTPEVVHILAKVETHNHPTAISPFPGAATGSGGEIRDEGAVGRGSSPKAGLCGFWVSDLLIPGHKQPWEMDVGKPAHYASSLDIMLEAPIGSARFNNEFGRPCLAGTFRTLLTDADASTDEVRGYHKPIMIAGGLGTVRPGHAIKNGNDVKPEAHVIVLGGPAMLIGLGGGAASSNTSAGESSVELDFDSVQRGNPEMERRAQMVIDHCRALKDENPIAFIHDVGAGGLSNALPELVNDAGYGGKFELRNVESADGSMSPLQIWCCEAQERYVLIVNKEDLGRFTSIAKRERCGFSNVGTVVPKDKDGVVKLVVTDRDSTEHPTPIDLPMSTLFPKDRKLERIVQSRKPQLLPFNAEKSLKEAYPQIPDHDLLRMAIERVLSLPSVGSKSFLITIGDRSVGGLTM